jgi:hypothetical protein
VWRNFPDVATADVDAFHAVIDSTGLVPAGLVVEVDTYRHRHAPLDDDGSLAELGRQFAAARRLGFSVVRATAGMAPSLLPRALAAAEAADLVLAFEIQGSQRPDDAVVRDIVDLALRTSSPCLGLTFDFSLAGAGLPAALDTALGRLGADDELVAAIRAAWAGNGGMPERLGAAMAAIGAHPAGDALRNLVASLFIRTSRGTVADWTELLPFARHAHAKYWDPDLGAIRPSHTDWIAALDASGFEGAVVSEWGGHELLDTTDADAFEVTRAHVTMLHEIAEAVGAGGADRDDGVLVPSTREGVSR